MEGGATRRAEDIFGYKQHRGKGYNNKTQQQQRNTNQERNSAAGAAAQSVLHLESVSFFPEERASKETKKQKKSYQKACGLNYLRVSTQCECDRKKR